MDVFRICLEKWGERLAASGRPARWNSAGTMVVYTAESRALACLENLVHRSGEGEEQRYLVLRIRIPDHLHPERVDEAGLPEDWTSAVHIERTRALGDAFVRAGKSALLRMPSALIAGEYNYLLNVMHPDFSEIRIIDREVFRFDRRLGAPK